MSVKECDDLSFDILRAKQTSSNQTRALSRSKNYGEEIE